MLSTNILYAYTSYLLTFWLFSTYWVVVFIGRILRFRKYKRGAARCTSDSESGYINSQFCYHYQTEIWKYTYMIIIASLELSCFSIFCLAYLIPYYISRHTQIFNHTTSCFEFVNQNENVKIASLISSILVSVARTNELFIMIIAMCLMSYLTDRIKKISSCHSTSNSRYLIFIAIVISSFIIVTSFERTLQFISSLTFNIFSFVYFCLFVNTTRNFKQTLLQRSLERLIQFGSNQEMKQYKYFKYTANSLCFGFFLIFFGEFLHLTSVHVGVTVITDRVCYFPYNLSPSQSNPTQTRVLHYIMISSRILIFTGVTIPFSQLVMITIAIWIKRIQKYIRGVPKIRYTTVPSSMLAPLVAS